jgi:DnaJ-class molecular chaperone
MDITTKTVVCPRCHGEGCIAVPSEDPQLPRDLVDCPCCHGRTLTKGQMRQWARDNAAPGDSPALVPRLYR